MSVMGRPPLGPRLVDALDIPEPICTQLRVILQTLAGQMSVVDAAQQLGISDTRFHTIRQQALRGAAAALEPRSPGRPPSKAPPEQDEIQRLKTELLELKASATAAQLREEIALLMPHLLRQEKKTKRRRGTMARTSRPSLTVR